MDLRNESTRGQMINVRRSRHADDDMTLPKDAVHTLVQSIQQLNKTITEYSRSVQKRSSKPHTINDAKQGLTTVFVRLVFLKLGEVDTIKENFAADVFVQARWREPSLDHLRSLDADAVDWSKYWNPKLHINNMIKQNTLSSWMALSRTPEGHVVVHRKLRVTGVFMERMELSQFPFDTQDLSVHVVSDRPETEVALEEDVSEVSSINAQSFVDEQEWQLHSHVEIQKKTCYPSFKDVKYKKPGLVFACKAFRKPGFFIYNILLVMFCILSLAFATFSVSEDKPQNRLQLSFTLVLTTVTFKFAVNKNLPKISYLTYLDFYVLFSMAQLCVICVWHALVVVIFENYGSEKAKKADHLALGILGTIYIAYNIVFAIIVTRSSLKRRWRNLALDREFMDRIDKAFDVFNSETPQHRQKYSGLEGLPMQHM